MPNYLTREGLAELEARRARILDIELPQALESVNTARSEGDLRENAAYQTAMKIREELEAELAEIENTLNGEYEIIETDTVQGSKTVQIGSHVKIQYLTDNSLHDIQIVGSSESNVLDGKISNESPLAESIIGKKVNQEASFKTPVGKVTVKILEIS